MPSDQGVELSAARMARWGLGAAFVLAILLAGCVAQRPVMQAPKDDTRCTEAAAGDALIGNWLSIRKQPGVSGELRTHFMLSADGTMRYGEQLVRPRGAPQGLSETGCWRREGQTMILRTIESNGSPVDTDDPIYVNRYQISSEAADRLVLQTSDGMRLEARRMPSDYRLPW